MQLPWFFATTPAPQPASRGGALRRRSVRTLTPWWTGLGERFVAWGEQAHHHRMGSWMQR